MSESISDSELGRSKQAASPKEHLRHLLGLGWSPKSALIDKYVKEHHLQRELSEWLAANGDAQSSTQPARRR